MKKLTAKPVTDALETETRNRVKAVTTALGRPPKLAVVLVGEDPASVIYTSQKGKKAVELGMLHETFQFPSTVLPDEVKACIDRLNHDRLIDGILIQRPLPKAFREQEVLYWVAREKDVDAFHPENAGRLALGMDCFKPCTPFGVMKLLEHYGYNPAGRIACVIGRSSIVGRPMATLLLQADATVIQVHSKTLDAAALCKQADIVIAAAGKAKLVNSTYLKHGAVVIDVGIHRGADGKLVGDVDVDSIAGVAAALSPVPGGVGPMTIALLMVNTVTAAESAVQAHYPHC